MSHAKSEVKDTDKGFAIFMKRARKHAKATGGVEVGIFDTATRQANPGDHGQPTTNIQVASWMEFGVPERRIPERSFLRSTVDRNAKKYEELLKRAHEKALNDGADEKHLLALIGEVAVADVRQTIRSQGFGEWEPLKESTIQAKGSSQALIHTGQLMNSITYKVVEGHPGGQGDAKSGHGGAAAHEEEQQGGGASGSEK